MTNTVINEGECYNITIKKGATYKENFVSCESVDSSGNPVNRDDLTGYTARMQIRRAFKADVIHELTTTSGITITALTGEIDLLISNTDTDAFPSLTGVYDLELISSGGEVTRFIEGKAIITENATR